MAINPYRIFPIYDAEMVQYYKGQRRSERPPHIFAVADAAYRALIEGKKDQSILITGESGAGKTENTKRVIQYLAATAGAHAHTLEQQIVRANPILEAFGNAQTVRNNNSSRFGKFVRIEFSNGVICGGNIERYLLEKGRVTHRNIQERSFHVFYQFLSGAPTEMKQALGVTGSAADYNYTKISNAHVEGVDDKAEFAQLSESMSVLGFTPEEQTSYFRIIASILLLGNLSFEEDAQGQARLTDHSAVEKVCACLGVPVEEFVTGLLNPVFKAGRDELVAQARDVAQVAYSVEALSRALYDRMFTRLVERINRTIDRTGPKGNFIGVLDIAGFEIFGRNSFEQLCINHTNEKLQQFFNHHMFVLEQEEYQRESLAWDYIDFGLDLQPTIDLIEKANPIGVLACLDEDCVMPRATDKSFCEKVSALWKGRSDKFETTRFGDGFLINHYAGRVEYSTEGWLVKNKDPLNENVTRLLARSQHGIVAGLFGEYVGTDEEVYQAQKGTKRGLFRTVAQKHRESLALLMQTLYATQPHFVRCIVPNEEKRPGLINSRLVIEQLKCNGVLEGIRICRLGYPNRMPFSEFVRLYEVLLPALADSPSLSNDGRQACKELLTRLNLEEGIAYKMGQSKVFFKAGEIGKFDEMRDARLSTVLRSFQALYRFVLAKRQRTRKARQQDAVQLLQRNIRLFLRLRTWSWWKLFSQVRPLLGVTRSENRIEELESEMERLTMERDQQLGVLRGDLDRERNMLFEVETRRRDLERENQQMNVQLAEANDSRAALVERKQIQELELARLKDRIANELEGQREQLAAKVTAYEKEQNELRRVLDEQKALVTLLKRQLDEVEFERLKLEKSEAIAKVRLAESETSLDEARRTRRDLEARLCQVEDAKRTLQEQLEDEAADLARRRQIEAAFEQQLSVLRQQHDDELAEREEDWDLTRKKLQREMHQLTFDFEQEKKTSLGLRETVKRYESGADNLATQLEAEMRNQNNWKREKDRLDARLKEVTRQHSEAIEREDALQAQLTTQYETIRECRVRLADLDETAASSERQRRVLEGRLDSLNETHREILTAKQTLEKSSTTLELQNADLMNRLHDEQDAVIILKEQLRAGEQMLKVAITELETERKTSERFNQEKAVLEMQVKELQLKLLESEATPGVSSRTPRRTSTPHQAILAQIEAEAAEKVQLIKDARRAERQVKELQSQLADRDRTRIGMEEALDKTDLRLRKAQTALEMLENRMAEVETARRRAERDAIEEREKAERLGREFDRLKSRSLLRTASTDIVPVAQ